MSGYWCNLDTPCPVWFHTQVVGRFFARCPGYIPARIAPGDAMPGTIMLDWTNWINNSDYWFDDNTVPGLENFADVRLPYLSVGICDDPWGNKTAVAEFIKHYGHAQLRQVWIRPGDTGPIGHLGFFRKRHADNHWPMVTDYLISGTLPERGSALFNH